MSLTNNYDEKTGTTWHGTNVALMVIASRKALEFVQEQVEAHGIDVAMTLSSDEAAAIGIDPHSDPTRVYSLRKALWRQHQLLLHQVRNLKPFTKQDMKSGKEVLEDFEGRVGFEPISDELTKEIDDDDGVTSDHDDDDKESVPGGEDDAAIEPEEEEEEDEEGEEEEGDDREYEQQQDDEDDEDDEEHDEEHDEDDEDDEEHDEDDEEVLDAQPDEEAEKTTGAKSGTSRAARPATKTRAASVKQSSIADNIFGPEEEEEEEEGRKNLLVHPKKKAKIA